MYGEGISSAPGIQELDQEATLCCESSHLAPHCPQDQVGFTSSHSPQALLIVGTWDCPMDQKQALNFSAPSCSGNASIPRGHYRLVFLQAPSGQGAASPCSTSAPLGSPSLSRAVSSAAGWPQLGQGP